MAEMLRKFKSSVGAALGSYLVSWTVYWVPMLTEKWFALFLKHISASYCLNQ